MRSQECVNHASRTQAQNALCYCYIDASKRQVSLIEKDHLSLRLLYLLLSILKLQFLQKFSPIYTYYRGTCIKQTPLGQYHMVVIERRHS